MTDLTHPDDATLAKLAEGKISGEELSALESHLDSCGSCRTLLAVVSNGSAPSVAVQRATLSPGEMLGRFEIERLIGAGAMGMLYVARDPQLGRRVALKLMRPAFNDETGRIRLLREAQSMAQLSHPNVVHVYELGELSGRVFIAMELLEGGTLRDWMKVPRTWREKLEMFVAAGRGLYAAHQAGVIHRDFKPENVMIGKDNRPRVGDFGLARPELIAEEELPLSAPMRITQVGAILGTPAYMSPEQLAGKPADALSDQYGFCVALYEALVGRRPFPTDSLVELRTLVMGGMPPPPSDGAVPAHVWAAIARGLHPDPKRRFDDLGELLDVLGLSAPPEQLPVPAPARKRDPLKTSRNIAIAALTSVVLAFIINKAATRHPSVAPAAEPAVAAPMVSEEPVALPTYLVMAPGAVETFTIDGADITHGPDDVVQVSTRNDLSTGTVAEVHAVSAGNATIKAGNHVTTVTSFEAMAPWAHPIQVQLKPGETVLRHFKGLERVMPMGPDAIADARTVHGDGVLLTALKPGTATFLFYLQGHNRVTEVVTVEGDEDESDDSEASDQAAMPALTGPRVALPASIEFDQGEQRVFDVESLERIAVGDDDTADVKTIGNDQLLVIAGDYGHTTLLVWAKGKRQSVDIRVRATEHKFHKGDIEVEAGDQKALDVVGIRRVAVGDDDIAEVKTIGDNELLVVGGKPGFTTMFIWTADGRRTQRDIRVLPSQKLSKVQSDEPDLYLAVGIQKVLTIPGIQRVAIGDSGICDVKTIGNDQLLLIGAGEGTTTLLVWSANGARKSYTVHVPKPANPPTSQSVSMNAGEKFELPKLSFRHVTSDTPEVVKVVSEGEGKVHLEALAEGRAEVITDQKDGSRTVYFIEVQPKGIEESLQEARKDIKDNDYSGAKRALTQCLTAKSPPLDCLMLMGSVELRLGHKPEAITWLKKFLKLAPNDYPDRKKAEELLMIEGG
ncbi:MAG: pilus assembly protein N-terminal domain-containing protein [Myxococcaceae bacterium]